MVLDFLLVKGDRVVMKMDPEARSWRSGLPDGIQGTVVGKLRYRRYANRYGIDTYSFAQPGIYELDGVPQVKWDNGETATASSYDIDAVDVAKFKQRLETQWHAPMRTGEDRNKLEHRLRNCVRLGDLPDAKFYELDRVHVKPFDSAGTVKSVMYSWALNDETGQFIDERGMCYHVELDRGGSTHVNDVDLELLMRGNMYNHVNGLPLEFVDIREEISWAKGLTQITEVRNPETQLYSWTKESALAAIQSGVGDCMTAGNGLFNTGWRVAVWKCKDSELGQRARLATMKSFNL
jgi:ribosomal protein L21E